MTNDSVLTGAIFVGAAVGVVAWFAAFRNVHQDRLKLVLLAVLAAIMIGLAFVLNGIALKLDDVGHVRDNQDCIIAILRTQHEDPPKVVTDTQLIDRDCPHPQPFP